MEFPRTAEITESDSCIVARKKRKRVNVWSASEIFGATSISYRFCIIEDKNLGREEAKLKDCAICVSVVGKDHVQRFRVHEDI